jgi:signal transduction histidine kinase
MKFNIRFKLVAFALFIALLVGGSISLYSIYQGRERILATFDREAREISGVISGTIVNDLYVLDLRSLRHRLQSVRVNPDIRYTYVTDLQGLVLSDGTGENALRDQKLTDRFSRDVLHSRGWISRVEGDLLKIGGPVFLPDGARVGHLQVGYSLDHAYKAVRDTTRTSLYITVIGVGIGAFLAFMVATGFSRPIWSLVQASREIGQGKLDTRLQVRRGDELGALAQSINQMAESLQMREAEAKGAKEAIEDRYAELETLQQMGQTILNSPDLETVLQGALDKVLSLGLLDLGAVRLLDRSGQLLETVVSRGFRDPKGVRIHQVRDATTGKTIDRVMTLKEPLVVENVQQSDGLRTFKKEGVHSAVVIPVRAKEEVLGVIHLGSRTPRKFRPEEIRLLEAIGSQVGIAVQKARLYEQTKEQALELEKANNVKNEMLRFVSHELKTPVNAVIGYAGMVREKMLGEINLEQERILEKIIARSRDLVGMINSLLEATRIEAGAAKAESREVGLDGFLDELRSSYDVPLGKELSLQWNYPCGLPAIRTDAGKLRHILQNLINNAIKYTDKGHVLVSACLRPNASAKLVEFQVSDTGIGIPEESMPFIFEMFQQANGLRKEPRGGVGLGLYIVKEFTEMLGGKIEVESEPGKGSTFTVAIPCELQN